MVRWLFYYETRANARAKSRSPTRKKATTHHEHREALREFCEVMDSRVSVNDNKVSVGGISCSLDLGLKILEIIYGRMIAEIVADRLEIPAEMRSFAN